MDELMVRRTKNILASINDETHQKNILIEAAKAFAFFVSDGVKNGLPRDAAFELAKDHFQTYGQAMIDFSKLVKIEWFPDD